MSGEPRPTSDQAARPSVILVVEDDVLIRLAVAEYLRECGHSVIEAASGDEAIAVFEAQLTVDIVFSDVQMPGSMDGFALARWVRSNRPGVAVILTSGVARAADAAGELCQDGPLVAKPYEFGNVEARIKRLLAARDAAAGKGRE